MKNTIKILLLAPLVLFVSASFAMENFYEANWQQEIEMLRYFKLQQESKKKKEQENKKKIEQQKKQNLPQNNNKKKIEYQENNKWLEQQNQLNEDRKLALKLQQEEEYLLKQENEEFEKNKKIEKEYENYYKNQQEQLENDRKLALKFQQEEDALIKQEKEDFKLAQALYEIEKQDLSKEQKQEEQLNFLFNKLAQQENNKAPLNKQKLPQKTSTLPTVGQQSGATCGYYAAVLALIAAADMTLEQLKAALLNPNIHNDVLKYLAQNNYVTNIDGAIIENIINQNKLLRSRIAIIEGPRALEFFKNKNNNVYINVEQEMKILAKAAQLFTQDKKPCAVLYNTGGHWICYVIRNENDTVHLYKMDPASGQANIIDYAPDAIENYLFSVFN